MRRSPFLSELQKILFLVVAQATIASSPWSQYKTPGLGFDEAAMVAMSASSAPAIDGRWLAFATLAGGDGDGWLDVFWCDRDANVNGIFDEPGQMKIRMVTVTAFDPSQDDHCFNPSVSSDGRWVVFQSASKVLAAGDTDAYEDVYLADTSTVPPSRYRVSIPSLPNQNRGHSGWPSVGISGNTVFVAFHSAADDIVLGQPNVQDVILAAMSVTNPAAPTFVALPSGSGPGSLYPSVAPNGSYVAFQRGDPVHIWAWKRSTGIATSIAPDYPGAHHPTVSNGGRVAFMTGATGFGSIVARDWDGASATWVNANPCKSAAISANGEYVAYLGPSGANPAAEKANRWRVSDSPGLPDHVVDAGNSGTTAITIADVADRARVSPGITFDGTDVSFCSSSSDLVVGDVNQYPDIFVLNDIVGRNWIDAAGTGQVDCPCFTGLHGRGCDNAAATGGLALIATGVASVSSDSVVFNLIGGRFGWQAGIYTATQGTPQVYGDGVAAFLPQGVQVGSVSFDLNGRAVLGSISQAHPVNLGGADAYQVFYRAPPPGFCDPSTASNTSNMIVIQWAP